MSASKAGPVSESPVEETEQAAITEVGPVLKHYGYCLDRKLKASRAKNPLEEAKLVLVGGRGLGSRENYARLKQLARDVYKRQYPSRARGQAGHLEGQAEREGEPDVYEVGRGAGL